MQKKIDKAQYPFMTKTPSKVGVEGAYLNIKKAIYENPTKLYSMGKNKTFLLRLGTRQGCPLSPLLFNIVLESLATPIRKQNKKNKNQMRDKYLQTTALTNDIGC